MARVVYSPAARHDVIGIAEWIARDDPAAAERVVDRLDDAVQLLSRFPEAGQSVEDLLPGMRRTTSGLYSIYYRTMGEEIDIVRIVHGARDVKQLFA